MEKAIKYYTNLIETFKHIKAEKDTALIDHPEKLFVNLDTYRKLTETETYVVIGRKGAGKTALIDIFRNSEKGSHEIIIDIIADQENSWLLYNWFYNIFSDLHKKTHDHREFFDMVSLFATAWAAAIQMIMMERIIRDEQMLERKFGAELDSIRKYLKKQLGVGDELRGRTVQSVLPVIFELIQRKIEIILELGGTIGVALGRIVAWVNKSIEKRIVDKEANDSLTKILIERPLKVLITLDKYDDFIDAMIVELDDSYQLSKRLNKSLDEDDRIFERAKMLTFQRNMLRGLLLATRKLRETQTYGNVHCALAIPQDRFEELRLRESAQYEVSFMDKILWTPLQLLEYFVRRCCFAMGMPMKCKTAEDLIRAYKDVLKSLGISEYVQNRTVREVREDFLLYLIRHSMWRPRDIQRYFLKYCEETLSRLKQQLDADSSNLITEVIRAESSAILDGEFFYEYQLEYPLLEDVINRFKGQPNVFSDEKLRNDILGKKGLSVDYNKMSNDQIIVRLYKVGFLGVRKLRALHKEYCVRQKNQLAYYSFYYNDPERNVRTLFGGGAKLSEGNSWVIHPIFYDRLDINATKNFIVHEMSWQAIVSQYAPFYKIGAFYDASRPSS